MLKRTALHLLAALLLAILSWTGITAPEQPAAGQVGPSEAGAVDRLVAHGLHNLTGVRAGATAPQAGTDVVAPDLASRAVSTAGSCAAMPSCNPAGWTQVFADDFSCTGLSGRWFAYGGQPGGDPGGYWSTSHVSVANGELILRGYRDARYGNKFVTAGVSTTHGFVQTYGKYLVRFRMDQGKGIAHAIMLWPADNSWPPEIDFSEDNGVTPRSLVTATVHYSMPGKTDTMVHRTASVDLSAGHTL